jgi:hypothetical protein
MGAVEALEPPLVFSLVGSTMLLRGMGSLTVSRPIGQFLSNLIMGILFSMSRALPFFYAFASAFVATLVLAGAEPRLEKQSRNNGRAPIPKLWHGLPGGKERLRGLAGSRSCRRRGIEEALFFPYRLATL